MQSSPRFLCTLANNGQRDNLFIIPSAGTSPMSLMFLARSLNPSHTVCSFTYAGMEDDREPHLEITEMAAVYVQDLLQAQREGPYRVAGYCFGGLVAYEIVRQLEAKGVSVERLVVIESFSPVFKGGPRTQDDDKKLGAAMELIYGNTMGRLSMLPPATAERLLNILTLHLGAASRYRAEPIKADIRVIRSRSHPHRLYQDWARCTMTRHEEVIIPGDTFSLLTPPHVQALADAVEKAWWLDRLPLTATGKVDRRALQEPDGPRPNLETPHIGPRTPIEDSLTRVWSEVLDVERVGVHDNFLDLGGDSLLAAQVMARVINIFQVEVPLGDLLKAPTVEEMALIVVERQASKADHADIERLLVELEDPKSG